MSSAGYVDGIEVLWRPGCPFCSRLRRGLRRHGIATTEINIWKDPGAAKLVRAVTGGDGNGPHGFRGDRGAGQSECEGSRQRRRD
ncbi:MAG TPA: glutaredoxin domain-containing protein [Mycobacterium sp.]